MSANQERAVALLEEIERIAARIAAEVAGLPEPVANAVGLATAEAISVELGGGDLYLGKSLAIHKRHREIWAGFTGDNYSDLAARFNLAEPYVRQVVQKMRKLDRASRQRDFFSPPDA